MVTLYYRLKQKIQFINRFIETVVNGEIKEVDCDGPRPESIEAIDVDLDNPTFELIVFFLKLNLIE